MAHPKQRTHAMRAKCFPQTGRGDPNYVQSMKKKEGKYKHKKTKTRRVEIIHNIPYDGLQQLSQQSQKDVAPSPTWGD